MFIEKRAMFEQRPLFNLIIITWVLLSCLLVFPSFFSGDMGLNNTLLVVAVTAIFSVPIATMYFYRRYYLWFSAGFASILLFAVWRQGQINVESAVEMDHLLNSLLPFGAVSLIVLLIVAKVAQSVFGANLVADTSDIVEQDLHPTRYDWLLAGLFLVVAIVLTALLRLLA